MNKPRKIDVNHNPLSPSQERMCKRFISTFGVSIFEIVDTTFFDWNMGFNFFGFASVFFIHNEVNFNLTYELEGLDYGFWLNCKDGDSIFFSVRNIFFLWQQRRYALDDFLAALHELSKSKK